MYIFRVGCMVLFLVPAIVFGCTGSTCRDCVNEKGCFFAVVVKGPKEGSCISATDFRKYRIRYSYNKLNDCTSYDRYMDREKRLSSNAYIPVPQTRQQDSGYVLKSKVNSTFTALNSIPKQNDTKINLPNKSIVFESLATTAEPSLFKKLVADISTSMTTTTTTEKKVLDIVTTTPYSDQTIFVEEMITSTPDTVTLQSIVTTNIPENISEAAPTEITTKSFEYYPELTTDFKATTLVPVSEPTLVYTSEPELTTMEMTTTLTTTTSTSPSPPSPIIENIISNYIFQKIPLGMDGGVPATTTSHSFDVLEPKGKKYSVIEDPKRSPIATGVKWPLNNNKLLLTDFTCTAWRDTIEEQMIRALCNSQRKMGRFLEQRVDFSIIQYYNDSPILEYATYWIVAMWQKRHCGGRN